MNSNDPWAQAIHESTACLRLQQRQRQSNSNGGNKGLSTIMVPLDAGTVYLEILEDQLVAAKIPDDESWSHPPTCLPANWNRFSDLYARDPVRAYQEVKSSAEASASQYEDEEDDEAGDVPNLYGMSENMDCRRLHIRILTSQSEIFACKAGIFAARDCKDFKEGAAQLQLALHKIHQALKVADSRISKWWTFMESARISDATSRTREKDALVEDANVVEVAIQNMTQRREKMLGLCHQEQNWLLRKLEPQWESRDEVKQRIGEERWKNNPRPKMDYAAQRREFEQRLRVVRQAMEALEALDATATTALHRANKMQYQLQHNMRPEPNTSSSDEAGTSRSTDEDIAQRRHNGHRPSAEWLSRRVDIRQYPDPTSFGWTFTGSWEAAEFFERSVVQNDREYLVKLDWFFTTATVKTSLDHPSQGKTQLFGKQVAPDEYTNILRNPRVHTGNRYQQRPKGGGRGGGRGGRDRGGRGQGGRGSRSNARSQTSTALRPSQVSPEQ